MNPGEFSQVAQVPVWPAMAFLGTVGSMIVGIVVWVFTNFELKRDAREKAATLETRMAAAEGVLTTIGRDVSYIRGRIEPK